MHVCMLDAMCCGKFGRFYRNSRKSQIKPHIQQKRIYLGIYNSRPKTKFPTWMIVKHYLIIAYYINKFKRTVCKSDC